MLSSSLLPLRRIAVLCMILFGILFLAPSRLSAQACGGLGIAPPSEGREFLLCFMQNELSGYDPTSTNYQDIYLASAGDTALVTITCRAFPGWSQVIKLAKNGSFVYRLSTDPVIANDAIIPDVGIIDSTVFKVISTTPIACYGMNNKHLTADAFLAFPLEVASTEYRVMSYYNSTEQHGADMPSEFCVAAFDDNTTVTIIPSAVTSDGTPAGTTITYVLNSGEGVLVQTDPSTSGLDLTGSIVRSDKPIVVYGGHARAEVPVDFRENDGGFGSRDHLAEEMPPVSDWGNSFIAKNFSRPDVEGDIMRVLALDDGTIVKVNGVVWGEPLKANEFRDTTIFQDNTTALNNIAAVESNNHILVGMIAHSAKDASSLGDPFLAIVPPLNQTYNDFTYFISNDSIDYDPNQQFLIVATEQSGVGTIAIDNIKIPANLFVTVPQLMNGTHYAVAAIQQSPGIHRIVSPNQPKQGFTILAYGWGTVISYGYTGGLLFGPQQGIISIPLPPHSVAPNPGDTSRNLPPPSITVRDILTERVYFDSARFIYSQNPQNIAVRLKKDIAMETGTIEMAEEKTLDLVTAKPIQETISGTVRIWYHSKLWMDLQPVDFPFTITPQQQAGVTTILAQTVVLENYPNPASGKTTIHFRIPAPAYISIKIYDALGRVVRTVMQQTVNSNDQQVQVSTKGIPAGEYTLELLAPELGISEHRHLIVTE